MASIACRYKHENRMQKGGETPQGCAKGMEKRISCN